jgi:hypothetical protein
VYTPIAETPQAALAVATYWMVVLTVAPFDGAETKTPAFANAVRNKNVPASLKWNRDCNRDNISLLHKVGSFEVRTRNQSNFSGRSSFGLRLNFFLGCFEEDKDTG